MWSISSAPGPRFTALAPRNCSTRWAPLGSPFAEGNSGSRSSTKCLRLAEGQAWGQGVSVPGVESSAGNRAQGPRRGGGYPRGRGHSESSPLCPEGRAAAVRGPARGCQGEGWRRKGPAVPGPGGAGESRPRPSGAAPVLTRARGGAGRERGSRCRPGDVMCRLLGRPRPPASPRDRRAPGRRGWGRGWGGERLSLWHLRAGRPLSCTARRKQASFLLLLVVSLSCKKIDGGLICVLLVFFLREGGCFYSCVNQG